VWPIIWLIGAFIFFIIWIIIIVVDSGLYSKYLKEKERRAKAKKKLDASKKAKELKWPENLPHYDL
jgi:hypothetical protein